MRSRIWKLSSEDFKHVIKSHICMSDICKYFKLHKQGSNYRTIKKRIQFEGIDTSHFLPKSKLFSIKNAKVLPKEELLRRMNTAEILCPKWLKSKLIKFDLIKQNCYECKIPPLWNNKQLVLQLDHINGNHSDNRLENLRLLCPNCHSQTETFCGKHNKKKIYQCIKCDGNVAKKGNICFLCAMKNNRKVERPSKETLKSELENNSLSSLGKKYGVSDNAVRKWCKQYQII